MPQAINNVLVTGGAGFIGHHVISELLKAGFSMRVMDNLSPPAHNGRLPDWFPKEVEFMRGDIRQKDDWRQALFGMDAVIHLAAYADYHLDFANYVRTNLESAALLFELIIEEKLPIKKIVAASSQSVYGEGKYNCPRHGAIYSPPRTNALLELHDWEQRCPDCQNILTPLPQQEDDQLHPQIPYGITKQASEQLLMNLSKRYNVPVAITRVSIAVGPNQSFRHFYSGAVRAFSVNALNNEPIQMNEDGKQSRDFVHVQDVASAYLTLLKDTRADFQIFNVGSGLATPVADLAKIVAEEAVVEFQPLFKNSYRLGDARHSLMDVSKLRGLGWEPKHTLSEAVRGYLNWVRKFGNLKQALDATYADMQKIGILTSS